MKKKLQSIKILFSDFDGVFTNNKVIVSEQGLESVICSRADGIGIEILKQHKIEVIVISSEINNAVMQRSKKLKIKAYNNVKNKGDLITKISKQKKIDLSNVGFIGNDINDLSALNLVGLPLIVKDSDLSLIKNNKFIKLNINGGEGVIRYIANLIII